MCISNNKMSVRVAALLKILIPTGPNSMLIWNKPESKTDKKTTSKQRSMFSQNLRYLDVHQSGAP